MTVAESPEVLAQRESVRLPDGKACLDCDHWVRTCSWLLGRRTGAETDCDWGPSRFRPLPTEAPT